MNLNVKKLRPEATIPTRANVTDAGLDIFACDDVTIPPSMYFSYSQKVLIGQAKVPSGIAVEIPPGYYGKISSRSGLAFKSGLYAFDGTIDASYRGEVGILLLNTTDRPYAVRKGDKVAQLIIIPCALVQPVEVDELSEAERGTNGFGSTGR